jgi:hypothetical protein
MRVSAQCSTSWLYPLWQGAHCNISYIMARKTMHGQALCVAWFKQLMRATQLDDTSHRRMYSARTCYLLSLLLSVQDVLLVSYKNDGTLVGHVSLSQPWSSRFDMSAAVSFGITDKPQAVLLAVRTHTSICQPSAEDPASKRPQIKFRRRRAAAYSIGPRRSPRALFGGLLYLLYMFLLVAVA